MMGADDNTITFLLTVRRGNTQVSTTTAVSLHSFQQLRDANYHGLYEATVNGLRVQLEPFVETLVTIPQVSDE